MAERPRGIGKGDGVRIVAPCGVFERDAFETGVRILEQAGLCPIFDTGIFEQQRYLAGSDARRRKELDLAIRSSEARCIWIARGGFGATRLLPSLDLEAIRAANKWLVGFSDTTALHAAWAKAGIASLHGANVTTLGLWSEDARDELFAVLAGNSCRPFAGRSLGARTTVRGPLCGGNLTVLAAMTGTGHLPSLAGTIVLIEDVGERPYRLDRALTQLLQAGVFAGVRGIVIGQLTGCVEPGAKEPLAYSALDVVVDALAPLALPILAGLPIGHEPTSRSVLLGGEWQLDADQATLTPV